MANSNTIEKLKKRQITKAIKIFTELDLKISIGSCGCCQSPWVRMYYKGKEIIGINNEEMNEINIDMFEKEEKENQNGPQYAILPEGT